MKIKLNYFNALSILLLLIIMACKDAPGENSEVHAPNEHPEGEHTNGEHGEEEGHMEEAMLSQAQFEALNMKIDSLRQRNMEGFVQVNGHLEVPPQNEATVTAVVGANVTSIKVIEGDKVAKGQILAYISHPGIIQMQTEFLNAANQVNFQEKEYNRQKKLYEAGVGSGDSFQKAEAAFQTAKAKLSGFQSQLQLLNLNPQHVLNGNIQQQIPVISPIKGAIEEVNVKTGQYIQAQSSMFEVVNTEHIHADLVVFEKDVAKVKVGQKVIFTVESLPGKELEAEILSISQTFREGPKAVHVHAEIVNKPQTLVPGMYVRGRIFVDETKVTALPDSALMRDGEKSFAFKAEKEGEGWSFKPVQVITGRSNNGWTAVKFLNDVEPHTKFAYNNAYYLLAEMKKGEGGHAH